MDQYYVDEAKDKRGFHTVHLEGCTYMAKDSLPIGIHHTCAPALLDAKDRGYNPNGCSHCSANCYSVGELPEK